MAQMRKAKSIYSELAIVTIACALAEAQRQAEEWASFLVERREVSGVL